MLEQSAYRQIAQLHAECINEGFLSTLGLPFLTLLYESIDKSEMSVLIAEVDKGSGRVIGFVAGTQSIGSIYKIILRRLPRLLFVLVPSLVRPSKLIRIIEVLRYRDNGRAIDLQIPDFELLSIAVSPAVRGTGCADRLYNELVAYCKDKGISAFKIVVGSSLLPAHSFYQRMGAVAVAHLEVHKGVDSTLYFHEL